MRAKLIIFCIVILVSFLNLNLFSEKLNVAYKIENDNIYKPVKIIVYEKEIYLLDLADQSIKVFDKKGVLKRSIVWEKRRRTFRNKKRYRLFCF
jgi:hypothetical protein